MKSKRAVSAILFADCIIYAFCILGLWQVAEKADLPFTISKGASGTFVIERVRALAPSSLKSGDRILSFDGRPLNSLEEVEFLLDGMRVGNALTLRIADDRGTLDVNVRLFHAYSWSYLVVAWLIGTLFFLSGLIVCMRRRDDIAALVYHFGAVGVAIVVMCTWGSYAIEPLVVGRIVRIVFSAAYAFVPALFLHFSLVFPSRRRTFLSGYEYSLYVVAAFLSAVMGVTFIKATSPVSFAWFSSFLAAFNVTRWFYALCVVLSVAIFVHSYRSAQEEMERRKIRWIMMGLAISSLGFVSLWQIPQLLTSRGLVSEEVVVLLSGATPIAFTVAIVKYHVLDIDHVFNRSSVYVMVLVIVLTIYVLIVGAIAGLVGSFTVTKSIIASFAAAAAVALLFDPVRKKVQLFVDKNFFRVRYDMKEVESQFSESVKNCFALDDLARTAVQTIVAAIPVERIGYFVFDREHDRLRLVAHQGFDLLQSRSVIFDVAGIKANLSFPIAVEGKIEPSVRYENADEEVFGRWGMTVAFPVNSERGGLLSFLVLGPKKSGTRFSIEDMDLLAYISRNAGLVHERILLQGRLAFEREERERLEEINKMKTYFVSSVSHDLRTPLTTIRMYTEALHERNKLPVKKYQAYLDTIHGEAMRLTRLIDNVLDVSKAERGKVTYTLKPERLDEIVNQATTAMSYEVHKGNCRLTTKLTSSDSRVLANKDAVIEALGNLIANSVEYSKKGAKVAVRTFPRNGSICVSVEDNGVGIRKEEVEHIFEAFYRGENGKAVRPGGTGLGLSVVKTVMDAHGGIIEIESEPGRGTKVTLVFPKLEAK